MEGFVACSEEVWRDIIDRRRQKMISATPGATRGDGKVRRVAADAFTAEKSRELVAAREPFVVEAGIEFCGIGDSDSNVFEFLRRVVGDCKVPVEKNNQPFDVMPMNQLLDHILAPPRTEEQKQDALYYMYDVPVAKRLGPLLEYWSVPRFFCENDFLRQTRLPHSFTNWPTLFIGAQGTQSATHVDRWHGDFWMIQIAGRKRWTIWPESETQLLSPQWKGKFDPTFPPIQELEGFGNPFRIDLCPGELLFVPGGSPHAVENLDAVVAMAGNFVTNANLEQVLADLSETRHRYVEDWALFNALSEVEFDDDELVTSADPKMQL